MIPAPPSTAPSSRSVFHFPVFHVPISVSLDHLQRHYLHLNSVWRACFCGKSIQDCPVGYNFLLSHSRIFPTYKANLGRIRLLRASSIPSYLISNNTFSSFMGSCSVIILLRMANRAI